MSVRIITGDCQDVLATLPDGSVHCCMTSPPFWRHRDYGIQGQLGIERSPVDFADAIVDIMSEVKRILVPDGSLWIELGDTYSAGGNGGGGTRARKRKKLESLQSRTGWRAPPSGYKVRDLSLTPFVVADRLRAAGWYLRKTIIWDKGTATEPPRLDRPSVSHSYLFLLTPGGKSRVRNPGEKWFASSVWKIAPSGDSSHVAPMPPELARRCIVAATETGDVVMDPFAGSGTTGVVADRLGRDAILIELNPAYAAMATERLHKDAGLFAEVA